MRAFSNERFRGAVRSICRLTGLLALLFAAGGAQGYTLKIATISPEGSYWMKKFKATAMKIEKQTEGRVKIKYYGGGSMGTDEDVLRKIRRGRVQLLHGAAISAGALSNYYADIQLYGMPFLFRNMAEVEHIRARMDDDLRAEIEASGFVNFGFADGGFAYTMTKNPVTTLEKMRSQKFWIPTNDPGSKIAVQAFGISPIPLSIADVLLALQTGAINAVPGPPIAALALQWHTQVRYALDVPLLYTYGLLVIDKQAFQRISPEDQIVVRQLMEASFAEIDHENKTQQSGALEVLRKQGVTFLKPDSAEMAGWEEKARAAYQRLVEEGAVSRENFARLQAYLADYRRGQGESH